MTAVHLHHPRPLPMVSLLAAHAEPFYTALSGWLSAQGETVQFRQGLEGPLTALLQGQVSLAALCGLIYVQHSAELEPLVAPVGLGRRTAGRPVYFSEVVVRADSPYRNVSELGSARWVLNESASFSGYVAPLAALRHQVRAVQGLRQAQFSGSHLSSLDWLRRGQADASAIDSGVFALAAEHDPGLRQELRVLTSFGPYPAPPIVVRRDVPAEVRLGLLTALTDLQHSAQGRAVLALGHVERFVPVSDADYDPVRAAHRQALEGRS